MTFVWSITSGKCLVLQDGKEIHFSTSRASIFDYSWTMKGNHILKIVAHAAPPLSQTPNFRQYDLFVNGQSFFTFPKVFRLGLAPGQIASPDSSGAMMAERGERHRRRGQSSDITNLEAPNNPDEVRKRLHVGRNHTGRFLLRVASASHASPPIFFFLHRRRPTSRRPFDSRFRTVNLSVEPSLGRPAKAL